MLKPTTTVFIPVSDQDRALEFYVDALGFEPLNDFAYGDGERWVEVRPPGSTMAVALPLGPAGVETGIALQTGELEELHDALGPAAGPILRAGDPPVRWAGAVLAGTPPMFLVRDPDGNSLLITLAG
jgi:catechol 2,3-dioxygenase-like lactoylglutathione lyase family enzyme